MALLNEPDAWGESRRTAAGLEVLDRLFPNVQFVVALAPLAFRRFPALLRTKALPLPKVRPRLRPPSLRPLPRGTVLLVDVDSSLPNLALMRLSQYHKAGGATVVLTRGVRSLPSAETVQASCVFHFPNTAAHLEILRARYGSALQLGGSGVDLARRLPPEIETLPPDYTLYPELGDRALGFLTRGCPQRCAFCVVPIKEGPPRRVGDFDDLLQGRKKLILLDDNLLAHPQALELLEEMARRDLAVNFNQTLDLRRLTSESAALLRRIRCSNAAFTRRSYHFSLNDARQLERLRDHYALLQTLSKDNVEFICMYGFNTPLAEDVERFRFLRSLPGAYVFVQQYQPVPGGPRPDLTRFFDARADALLDELIRILFPQNMKSMEKYYRWLALLYASQCGRVHSNLVNTLFRFNSRARMGDFLHRLEELCRLGQTGPNRT